MFTITDGTVTVVLPGALHGYLILMDGAATDMVVSTIRGETDIVLGDGVALVTDTDMAATAVLAGVVTEHGALLTAITMDITITRTETEDMLTTALEEVIIQTPMLFQETILDTHLDQMLIEVVDLHQGTLLPDQDLMQTEVQLHVALMPTVLRHQEEL